MEIGGCADEEEDDEEEGLEVEDCCLGMCEWCLDLRGVRESEHCGLV